MERSPDSTAAERVKLHRCFYAVRFEPPTTAYLGSIIAGLDAHGADVAWVREANLHLTLRFLGEITDEQLERAVAAADDVPRGTMLLSAHGLGAFPGLRNARVVWAGVAAASMVERSRLDALQAHTERWARVLGVPPENRRYRPHITLGRVRRPGDKLRELIDDVTTRECQSPPSRISELLLLRSTLSSRGSYYEEIARWSL
jgi:RNA 2',3'-cyclic 3'-phosphodiesterase